MHLNSIYMFLIKTLQKNTNMKYLHIGCQEHQIWKTAENRKLSTRLRATMPHTHTQTYIESVCVYVCMWHRQTSTPRFLRRRIKLNQFNYLSILQVMALFTSHLLPCIMSERRHTYCDVMSLILAEHV